MRSNASVLATEPRPWLRPLVASRLTLFALCWLGLVVMPLFPQAGQWQAFAHLPALDGWARWDSGWYWTIAEQGWRYDGTYSNINFFPLYSFVSLALSLPLRWALSDAAAFYAAAIFVSQTAFAVALAGVARFGDATVGSSATRRGLWLIALFPFSMFFSAVYAESLYLALAVWSFVLSREERPLAAGLLAALAGATRIVGFVVVPALALDLVWRARRWPRPAEWAGLVVGALGTAAPLGYCALRYGDLLLPFHTHVSQGRTISLAHVPNAVHDLVAGGGLMPALAVSYLLLLPLAVGLTVVTARRVSPGAALFCAASLVLAALSGLEGTGRFVAVLFPLFLAAGAIVRRRALFVAIAAVCAAELIFVTYWFSHWRHVT
jgi:hypothetical protein